MKNLKRKVALLLAFVMVLSLVPSMGAFGASGVQFRVTSGYGRGGAGVDVRAVGYRAYLMEPGVQTAEFEFEVDRVWFTAALENAAIAANGMLAVSQGGVDVLVPHFQLEVRVSGRRSLGGGNYSPHSSLTAMPSVTGHGGAIAHSYLGNSDRDADVRLGSISAVPAANLFVRGEVLVQSANATVSLYLRTVVDGVPYRTPILANQPLVAEWAVLEAPETTPGLVVSRVPDNPVNLTRFAHTITTMPPIRVQEYRVGTMLDADYVEVSLTAPTGFRWAVPGRAPIGDPGNARHFDVPAGRFNISIGGRLGSGFLELHPHGESPSVTVPTTLGHGFYSLNPGLTQLTFVVSVGQLRTAVGTSGHATEHARFDIEDLRLEPIHPGFEHAHNTRFDVRVTTRNLSSTSPVTPVGPPGNARGTIVPGTNRDIHVATFWRQGIQLGVSDAPTLITAGRADQVTVPFTITELAPNSFNPAAGLSVSVRVDNPGVEISAVYWRVNEVGEDPDDFNRQDLDLPVSLFMRQFDTGAGANYTREIEMKLVLDVLPGFGVTDWSRSIVAEVDVFSINMLAAGNRTVNIATVRDPITLGAGAPVELQIHGDPFGVIIPATLPTVTLREEYVGALPNGGHLYIYLVPTIGRIVFNDPFGNLGLRTPPVPVIAPGSGLALSAGAIIPPNSPDNDTNFIKIRYVVENPSAAAPALITFAGGVIEGVATTIEGLEVSFAVGGNAVVDNWDSDVAALVPYRVPVARFGAPADFDIPGETPTPGVTPGPVLPTPPPGPAPAETVRIPFGMAATPVFEGGAVGMISSGMVPFLFDGATATRFGSILIIQGYNVRGNGVRIELAIGDSFAEIGGQEFDIAFMSRTALPGGGFATSGPMGTVWPIEMDGQFMIPIRFLARAFGYTGVDFNPIANEIGRAHV